MFVANRSHGIRNNARLHRGEHVFVVEDVAIVVIADDHSLLLRILQPQREGEPSLLPGWKRHGLPDAQKE